MESFIHIYGENLCLYLSIIVHLIFHGESLSLYLFIGHLTTSHFTKKVCVCTCLQRPLTT